MMIQPSEKEIKLLEKIQEAILSGNKSELELLEEEYKKVIFAEDEALKDCPFAH